MSNSIDDRVVSLEFDNGKFERNVKTSLVTLEDLKKALDFSGIKDSTKSISDAVKNVDFSNMEKGVNSLSERFSALGIMGKRVLENLVDSAMAAGKRMWDASVGQITAGGKKRALNLEQARFQMAGLFKESMNGKKVEAVMNDVDEAVTGTAYSLDEAAVVAAQLAASNIEASEAGGEMLNVLKAIAGTAAMTGDDFATIGNIFTKVAGNGRMMGQELLQLSAHGLNAAATIRDYWNDVLNGNVEATDEMIYNLSRLSGGMEVTEADIRELTSEGVISFEIFSNAMQHAFGDAAQKANDTYAGSLSNVRAALSRLGAKFYTPYLEDMRDVFNALRPAINSFNDALGKLEDESSIISNVVKVMHGVRDFAVDFLNAFTELGVATPIVHSIYNIFKALLGVLAPIGRAFKSVFASSGLSAIKTFAEFLEMLTEKLILSEKASKALEIVFKGLFTVIKVGFKILGGVLWVITHLVEGISFLVAAVQTGISKFIEFIKNTKAFQFIAGRLTKVFYILSSHTLDLSSKLESLKGILFRGVLQPLYLRLKGLIGVIGPFASKTKDIFKVFSGKAINTIPKVVGGISDAMVHLIRSVLANGPKVGAAIKDLFASFFYFISNFDWRVFVRAIDGILGAITGILQNIAAYTGPIGNALFDILISAIDTIGERSPELIHALVNALKLIIKAAFIELLGIVTGLGGMVAGFFGVVLGGMKRDSDGASKGLSSSLSKIVSIWNKFKSSLKDVFEKIKAFVKPFTDSLHRLLGDSSLLDILNTGSLVIFVTEFKKITKGLSDQESILSKIKKLPDKIKEFFTKLKEAITGPVKEISTAKIVALTLGIGVLAFALYQLSKIDGESLNIALTTMLGLLGEFMGAIYALSKIDLGSAHILAVGGMLLGIGLALKFIAQAVAVIAKVPNLENIGASFGAVFLLLAEMVTAIALLSKQNKDLSDTNLKNLAATAIGIIALAAGVKILASAMTILAGLDAKGIKKGVILIGVFLTALAVTINQTANNPDLKGARSVIIGFAIALGLLAGVIWLLSNLEWSAFLKGLTMVAYEMVLLVAAVKAIGKTELAGTAATIMALAIAVNLLTLPIILLGNMPWGVLLKGLGAVAAMLLALGLSMKVMGAAKQYTLGAAAAILALALALNLLLIPIVTIANMKGAFKGVAGVMAILITMAAAISVMSAIAAGMDPAAAFNLAAMSLAMLSMAAAISILVVPLTLLSKIPFGGALKAIILMSAALIALGGAMAVVGMMAGPMLIGTAAFLVFGLAIAALGVGLKAAATGLMSFAALGITAAATISGMLLTLSAGIAGALIILSDAIGEAIGRLLASLGRSIHEHKGEVRNLCVDLIDIVADAINQAGEKLIDVFFNLTIKLLDALLEKTPEIVDKLITWVIQIIDGITARVPELGASIGNLIAAIMGVFEENGAEPPSMENIILAIGGIATVITVLQALPLTAGLAAGLQFVEFMGVFALMLAALAGLSKIEGFTEFMAGGLDLLFVLAEGIGGFVGHLVGALAHGIIDELPKIAMKLSTFADDIVGFVDIMSGIDEGVTKGVSNLASAILTLTATDIIDGFLRCFGAGVNFSTMGEQLDSFAPYMVSFAEQMSDVGADVVESSANAALAIAEMFKLIQDNDIFSAFESAPNMKTFGEQLVDFGTCLKDYNAAMDGFEISDGFKNSVEAASQLIALNKALNGSTSWMDDLFGSTNLESFGKQLVSFGDSLIGYGDKIKDFKMTDSFKQSVEAASVLVDLNAALADSTSMWDQLFGKADLDTFGTQLEMFGKGLASYCESVKDVENIDTAAEAATFAAKLITALGGVDSAGVVAGSKLPELGENLTAFAPGLVDFADAVNGVGFANVAPAADAASLLVDTFAGKEIPTGENLTLMGARLQNFGPMIASFANSIDGVAFANAKSAINAAGSWADFLQDLDGITIGSVQDFREALNTLKTVDVTGLEEAFATAAGNMKDIVTKMFAQLNVKFVAQYGKFRTYGANLMDKVKAGMESKQGAIKTSLELIISRASAGTSSGGFYAAGQNASQGFINGMQSSISRYGSQAAGRQIAQWALEAARRELDSHSPSREFMKIGMNATEGFRLGILDDAKGAAAASEQVANFALTAIAKTMELADQNMDYTPTITPVLDLSSIQNGISTMNSMMNGRSYNLAASTGGVNTPGFGLLAGLNARTASAGNGDIFSALDDLRAEVRSLHGDVTNLQVVMDSGALVGSIAPKMDNQLGKMAVYKGRGN